MTIPSLCRGKERKDMAPFASLERRIWIYVPTKTSRNWGKEIFIKDVGVL